MEFERQDETAAEREAREKTTRVLLAEEQQFVDGLAEQLLTFTDALSGHPLYPYQRPFAKRLFQSLIIGDGQIITALFSRQSGKSETVANCVATAMVMLPRLAKAYPEWLDRFKEGVWVGAFAPVDYQADILYSRILQRLKSKRAKEIFADPNIDEKLIGNGNPVSLRCGSSVTKNTAHPSANIEGDTFHIILVDECQRAKSSVINNSIMPMATATGGTKVFTGTPGYEKNVFFDTIQKNKRRAVAPGAVWNNHYQVDWKEAAKYNQWYEQQALQELMRLGEDSDEFRRQYCNQWLLEKGMFTTSQQLDGLGDERMRELVRTYTRTPVVVGVDLGRKQDRTIVTVVFVDWDHPDSFGYYHHRILNWLDLEGVDWEEQYFQVLEFLRRYNVWKVGVDTNGMGDVWIDRMRRLMPQLDFVDLGSSPTEQSRRWKYLRELLSMGKISWPGGEAVQATRVWRRFRQEMEDLEIEFKGPNVLGKAPTAQDAHDDYPDSLAMACILTTVEEESSVESCPNYFYNESGRSLNRM